MKYFIDTEFLEGTQKKWFGQTKPTIDLISIGIVAEDGREYYAISKDFNLKEAWNRFDRAEQTMFEKQNGFEGRKIYWIRENVLKPIYVDLVSIEKSCDYGCDYRLIAESNISDNNRYRSLKRLINKHGKSNKQIAKEIVEFCQPLDGLSIKANKPVVDKTLNYKIIGKRMAPQFYGYYCDYDWVVFCWLFGKMIDLPKGFPMYCIDLKQCLDNEANQMVFTSINGSSRPESHSEKLEAIRSFDSYPKQINEHNALSDARWNYQLYKFLNTL